MLTALVGRPLDVDVRVCGELYSVVWLEPMSGGLYVQVEVEGVW